MVKPNSRGKRSKKVKNVTAALVTESQSGDPAKPHEFGPIQTDPQEPDDLVELEETDKGRATVLPGTHVVCAPISPSKVPSARQIVRNAPLRVRLVWDVIEQNGIEIISTPREMGNHVHFECVSAQSGIGMDDIRQLLSREIRKVGMLVKPEDIKVHQWGERRFTVPVRVQNLAPDEQFLHSDNYRSIEYNGVSYDLSPLAAAIVKVLHQAYKQNQAMPWVDAESLRQRAGMQFNQKRIDHPFRAADGSRFWKTLIVADPNKRRYRLNLPDHL